MMDTEIDKEIETCQKVFDRRDELYKELYTKTPNILKDSTDSTWKETRREKKVRFFLDLEDQFYCTQIKADLNLHKSEIELFTLLMAQHAYECFLKNNPLDLTEKQEEILLLVSDNKEQYELLRLLCAGKIKEEEAKSIFMRYRDPLSDSDIQKLRLFMDKVKKCRENPILNFPEKPKEITIEEITEYIERKTKKGSNK